MAWQHIKPDVCPMGQNVGKIFGTEHTAFDSRTNKLLRSIIQNEYTNNRRNKMAAIKRPRSAGKSASGRLYHDASLRRTRKENNMKNSFMLQSENTHCLFQPTVYAQSSKKKVQQTPSLCASTSVPQFERTMIANKTQNSLLNSDSRAELQAKANKKLILSSVNADLMKKTYSSSSAATLSVPQEAWAGLTDQVSESFPNQNQIKAENIARHKKLKQYRRAHAQRRVKAERWLAQWYENGNSAHLKSENSDREMQFT